MAVHGVNVGEVYHRRLVAQMFQGHISEVEVYALYQKVGRYKHFGIGVVHHGTVVADTFFGGYVDQGKIAGETVD